MRHFVLILFCNFLSSGNLHGVYNGLNYHMPPADSVLGPEVAEENIWPMQAYQTFGGNYYGTARRNIIAKPCLRQNSPQDVSFEQTKQIQRYGNNLQNFPFVQSTNNKQEIFSSNIQDVNFQPSVFDQVNTQFETQYDSTQYMPQSENYQLINQVEEPSPTRRSSLTEAEKKIESNLDSIVLRTQVSEDEVSLKSDNNNEMSESLQSSDSEDLSSKIQEKGTTFKTKESSSKSASEEDISKEAKFEDTEPIFKTSKQKEDNFEVTTDLIANPLTPELPVLRDLSYSHETSEIECSHKKPSDKKLHDASRRFLAGFDNNLPTYQKTTSSKNSARPGTESGTNLGNNLNINPGINPSNNLNSNSGNNSIYSSHSNTQDNVLRTNIKDLGKENLLRSQDTAISNAATAMKEPTDSSSKSTNAKEIGRTGSFYNDPAQGQGISYIKKKTTLMLMDYDRICYACSTANNPACLQPDRKTAVKYCRKGANACVTKTFGSGSTLTLIRDCGRSCADAEVPGLVPKFKTCSICYSDLCNSAYSINVHSLILTIPTVVLIVLVKPLM